MLRTAPKRLAPRHRRLRTVPTSPTIRLAVAPKHNPNGTVFPRHNGTFCQCPGQMGLDQYEVRRLLTPLVWKANFPPDFVLSWSWWRLRHQARACRFHYRRLELPDSIVRL